MVRFYSATSLRHHPPRRYIITPPFTSQWAEILSILKRQRVSELNELISDREESAALRAWLARFVVDSKLRSRGFREQMRDPVTEVRFQFRKRLESAEADFRPHFPDQPRGCVVIR